MTTTAKMLIRLKAHDLNRDQASLFGYYSPVTGEVSAHPPLCSCGTCSIPVERFAQPAALLIESIPEPWEAENENLS